VRQKGFVLLPVIIIIALVVALGFFIYQNTQLQKSGKNATSPSAAPNTNLPKASVTSDPTVNWKTYINSQYRFSLKYPAGYSFEENKQSNRTQVIFNKGQTDYFSIQAQINYPVNQSKYYLDTPANGTRKIGEITWNTFYLPKGYQDAGMQKVTPIYAIQLEQNSILYSISGFQSEQIPGIIYQTISTFKFTK